jgi:phage terminase large subunit-like protein
MRENKPKEFANAILTMGNEEALDIIYDYNIFARKSQLPPEGDWRYWTILAGRGYGKTYLASNLVNIRAMKSKCIIAVCGQHGKDLKRVIFDIGPSSIIQTAHPKLREFLKEHYNKQDAMITYPNGSVVIGVSGDSPDSARGINSDLCVLDEIAKYKDPEETFIQLELGLRGHNAQMVTITTPRPIKIIKDLYNSAVIDKDPLYRITLGSTFENSANLDAKFMEAVKKRYAGTRIERQEIFGEILWESESALFSPADIEKYRVETHPELKRIIVAVDPAITAGEKSDSTGIIVAGVDFEGEIYILADRTMKGTPQQWASLVGETYSLYNADAVIAEKNQGGDMVQTTIQSFGGNIPVKLVTATRGKIIRAEGPSLYFEQGKIHMVGNFPDLEQQMVEYDGSQRKSPDNYDAFIWACTELMLGKQSHVTSIDFLM